MKDQLVTFETAKLAKEKGFEIKTMPFYRVIEPMSSDVKYFGKKDKEILVKYNNQFDSVWSDFSAPTQSLLQKWLREKHKIHAFAHPVEDLNSFLSIVDVMTPSAFERLYISYNEYNNFENALERSLKEGLKLLKDKK